MEEVGERESKQRRASTPRVAKASKETGKQGKQSKDKLSNYEQYGEPERKSSKEVKSSKEEVRESRRQETKEERKARHETKEERKERKETKEERKERKDRDLRKATKDSSRIHHTEREEGNTEKTSIKDGGSSKEGGSSKGREDKERKPDRNKEHKNTRETVPEQERERSVLNASSIDRKEEGEASSTTRASPLHKSAKTSRQSEGAATDKRRAGEKGAGSSSLHGNVGSNARKEERRRGVKQGQKPKDSLHEDKGKGKEAAKDVACVEEDTDAAQEYEAASKANRLALHTEIDAQLPDLKRLQTLLELAVEAETEAVHKHFTGRNAMVAQLFEEATSQFIIESEGITISKLKRQASRPVAPQKLMDNPINEAKAREEDKLKQALARFQTEEREWERVLAKKPSEAPVFDALPAAGCMPPSSHALMHELSIAHRNILTSSTGTESELPELLAWAHGHIHSGLDKPRNALAAIEDRSVQVEHLHSKLITSMRSAVRAPFAGGSNTKDLLRTLAAS